MPSDELVCDICCNPTSYIHAEANREAVLKVLCGIYTVMAGAEHGQVVINGVAYDILTGDLSAATSGDNTIVAVAAGKLLYMFGWIMSAAAAVDVNWKMGATTKIGPLHVGVTGGNVVNPNYPNEWFKGADGEDLILNLSGNVNVGGGFKYALIDA
jgi:hypothetical protein